MINNLNLKNKKRLHQHLLSLSGALIVFSISNAQTITVNPGTDWTVNVPPITEAGIDYTGTYTSTSNLVTLSGNLPGNFLTILGGSSARISVHYIPNPTWNSNLKLYATRNNSGAARVNGICILCSASINNGTTYVEIPQSVSNTLFTINFSGGLGLGNSITYSGVQIQLQIRGVSVTVPVDNYSATIVYTIGPS